jgi:thiamine biosynthesis lipoprotein
MAGILREWSIESALLHGGRSSVLALEAPSGQKGWPLSTSDPENPDRILDKHFLRFRALSGSGLKKGSHIVNPYTGYPVMERLAAWAGSENAALSDALSTAFMIMEISEIKHYISNHCTVSGLIITGGKNNDERKIIRWDRKR